MAAAKSIFLVGALGERVVPNVTLSGPAARRRKTRLSPMPPASMFRYTGAVAARYAAARAREALSGRGTRTGAFKEETVMVLRSLVLIVALNRCKIDF